MAAGDFSASSLLQIKLKAEEKWKDGRYAADFAPQAEAAVAVLKNQTATFKELDNPEKDNTLAVTWVKACGITAANCATDNCDLTEPEMETATKTMPIDICKKAGFSVSRNKTRTNMYDREELIAKGLANSVKALDEFWAQQTLIKLKAFASKNLAVAPFAWDAAKNTTIIPVAHYGSLGTTSSLQLPTMLIKQAIQNKITNPYFIDNGKMYLDYVNSQLMQGATDGASKAALGRAAMLNLSIDLFNFGAAGITNATTIAVAKGAVAMKTINKHGDTPEVIGGTVGQTRYTIPSIALAGVKYDVFYSVKCVNNDIVDMFRVVTNGGIWLNPEGCVTGGVTPSGVLTFTASDEAV